MIVNKQEYYYKKLLKSANNNADKTVEISDKVAEELGLKEVEVNPDISQDPIEPELPNDPEDVDWSKEYLTFEVLEDGTFSFTYNDLYYSINNGKSWISLAAETQTQLIPAGTKVLWKRDSNISTKDGCSGIGTFSSTGKFNVMGNILSLRYNDFINKLLDNTNDFDKHCFRYLFGSCKNLISAQYLILPNTDLTDLYYKGYYHIDAGLNGFKIEEEYVSTYQGMFHNCVNLIKAPKLLATTLCMRCYESMFYGCISLEKAPNLLAKDLEQECYKLMFHNCSSINYIKMMATDVSADGCLDSWVDGVSQTGTFIKSKDLDFDNIGSSGIPAGWEVIEE